MKSLRPQASRRRVLAGTSVALGLAATTLTTVSAPAQSTTTSDCPAAYPIGRLDNGHPVTGLTVTRGVTPQEFTGNVIDVLRDGIAPGLDMIVVELHSAEIDKVGGIWQGMSGSPVYAADGRLIGAVSYGLAWGPSPIAGVTPAADMQDLLAAAGSGEDSASETLQQAADAEQVDLPASTAREIQASGAATRTETRNGLERLAMPLGISGMVNQQRLRLAERSFGFEDAPVYRSAAAAGSTTDTDPATTILPGGNLAASASYGDVSTIGVGTATAVCGDEVLAFGHPAFFTGPSSLTMHGAKALFIQPESLGAPFKVANPTGPVGTIVDDRIAGLRGVLGDAPATTKVTSYVADADNDRTGTTWISVPDAVPDIAAMHLMADQDRVFDGIGKGSADVSWTVEGRRADGTPFSFTRADRYADTFDVTFWPSNDLYSQLSTLQYNDIENLTITDVRTTSTLSRTVEKYVVRGVELRRAGTWVTVNRRNPIHTRPGATLKLRVQLGSYRNLIPGRTVRVDVPVPSSIRFGEGSLDVMGGNYSADFFGLFFEEFLGFGGPAKQPTTVDGLIRRIERQPTRDETIASLTLFGMRSGRMVTREASTRVDEVVDGGVSVPVLVIDRRR